MQRRSRRHTSWLARVRRGRSAPSNARSVSAGLQPLQDEVGVNVKSDLHRGRVMTQRPTRWLGYEDDKVRRLTLEALQLGFNHFKMKVGFNVDADLRRRGDHPCRPDQRI